MTGLPSASVSVQHTSLSADDKPQHRPILQCRSAAGQPIEWGLTGGSLAASEDWSLNPPGAISSAKPDVGRVVQCAASSMRSAPSKWYAKRTRTPKPAHCEKMRPGET